MVLIALFITEQGSVFGANWLAQKYSPTQRKCFVCNYCFAGARPLDGIVNGGYNSDDLLESTWKGAAAGAVGGGAGAWGSGAYSSLTGGFAGGATGSALNGERDWDILKGGLMGAGMAFSSYSLKWSIENIDGKYIEFDSDGIPLEIPREANDGVFNENEYQKQAHRILETARIRYALDNGYNPLECEAGASFRLKNDFWMGKSYLDHGEIGLSKIGYKNGERTSGVSFRSREGDNFRMHLHTKDGYELGIGEYTSSRHPSAQDYSNARGYLNHGVSSYASAYGKNGSVELYKYTYTNKDPRFGIAVW